MIRRLLLLAALLCAPLLAPLPAQAQQAIVVTSCGGLTFDAGPLRPLTQDTTGTLCTAGGPGGTTSTVTQASTTSGQSGTLVQGAVTTSAPTYVTAKTNPLSLTTGGALRVDNSIGGVSPRLIAPNGIITFNSTADTPVVNSVLWLQNAASGNGIAAYSAAHGLDTAGSTTPTAAAVGEYDDVSPTTITENQFGYVRMGADRTLLTNNLSVYPYSAISHAVATPLTAHSGNVAAGTAAATLTGTATTTVYITGFTCTMGGATAAAEVDVTVTGPLGGTMTYTHGAPLGAGVPPSILNVQFSPPVPASAVNTTIVVSQPSGGSGNLHSACNATGFYM